MKIKSIPFNQLIGLTPAEPPRILTLDQSDRLTNHLGTVHASAQLALAEATSGQVLINRFGESTDETLVVVRRVEAKFRAPLLGRVVSRTSISDDALRVFSEKLNSRGRASVSIPVEVLDEHENVGLVATIEWFSQRRIES